jgi:hypothetical protein
LVFGSIIWTDMNILPKTKDHPLKTRKVFGLFLRMSCAGGADFAAWKEIIF